MDMFSLKLLVLLFNCMGVHSDSTMCMKCNNVDSPDKCNLFTSCSHGTRCHYEARQGSDNRVYYSAGCGSTYKCLDDENCCLSDLCNGHMLKELAKQFAVRTSIPTTAATTLHQTTEETVPDTTTVVTTTTTTTLPTTPAFHLTKGGTCHVCSGEKCGLASYQDTTTCSDDFPYCINIIQNDETGDKLITKRCASFGDCQVSQQLNDPNRSSFDAAEIYPSQFKCSFCCETSFCNFNVVPDMNTMLLGK